jgi:hypothetical protein
MTDESTALAIETPASATEAQIKLDTLIADPAWTDRFMNGDHIAKREFEALSGAADGASTAEDVVASVMGGKAPEFGNSEQRQMAVAVDSFREIGIRDGVTTEFLSGKQVTPDEYQAVASWKKEHMGDAAFVKRFLDGGVKERQLMTIANMVLVNGVKAEARS